MDLVNSVTQNSNNKGATMENKALNNDQAGRVISAAMNKPDPNDKIPQYLRVIGMDPRKFWPKKYRFTREKTPGQMNPLSVEQRNFYELNGYLVIDGCVGARLMGAIRDSYLMSESVADEQLVDKLVSGNNRLLQYVKCFCDDRVMLMTHRFVASLQNGCANNDERSQAERRARLDQGGPIVRQKLGRDWLYLPFRPVDRVVCTVTALSPINNVIVVAPGTHRIGQCSISSTGPSQTQARKELFEFGPSKLSELLEPSNKRFKYVNLKPGQTLFYHPGLVHGFSDDLVASRGVKQLAVLAYYAAADCQFVKLEAPPEASGQVPLGLSQLGADPAHFESWRNRARLLNDSSSNM